MSGLGQDHFSPAAEWGSMLLPWSPALPPSHWFPECHDGHCQGSQSRSRGEAQVTAWFTWASPLFYRVWYTVSKQVSSNRRDVSIDTHQVIAGVCSFGANYEAGWAFGRQPEHRKCSVNGAIYYNCYYCDVCSRIWARLGFLTTDTSGLQRLLGT